MLRRGVKSGVKTCYFWPISPLQIRQRTPVTPRKCYKLSYLTPTRSSFGSRGSPVRIWPPRPTRPPSPSDDLGSVTDDTPEPTVKSTVFRPVAVPKNSPKLLPAERPYGSGGAGHRPCKGRRPILKECTLAGRWGKKWGNMLHPAAFPTRTPVTPRKCYKLSYLTLSCS